MDTQKNFNWLAGFLFLVLMCQSPSAIAATRHDPQKAEPNFAMNKFIRAMETGDIALFLSFVSKQSGVKEMNTIDSRHLSRIDTLKYTPLAAEFRLKQKRGHYREFFQPGDVNSEFEDTTYFDMIKSVRQGRWVNVDHDTFIPALGVPWLGRHALYVKWQRIGSRWFLKEIGRPVS